MPSNSPIVYASKVIEAASSGQLDGKLGDEKRALTDSGIEFTVVRIGNRANVQLLATPDKIPQDVPKGYSPMQVGILAEIHYRKIDYENRPK